MGTHRLGSFHGDGARDGHLSSSVMGGYGWGKGLPCGRRFKISPHKNIMVKPINRLNQGGGGRHQLPQIDIIA